MARGGVGLLWDLTAVDHASPTFLRVAGAADKAAASTAKASAGTAAAAARMGAVGAKLTKSVTLPLLGIAAVSVDQASKYQKSLNTIQVATDRTNAQMAQGSKGLLSIAKSTGTGLSALTDSFYTASKSGLSVAQSLAVTKAAAQGAKAENADLGTVTGALTSIMASYGSSLKNPVAAMNEVIKGAGLAKTNMQDFASSLSNVVPLAASLHISFADVAGAIDTMTQHGETAQRATDNLSNLITNLAGQNNVASQSLQQLGVNTIKLSKNLGKRGLVGSLDLVLSAINKHGKDGVIVTSAFKHAATATSSLKTELAAMPATLQKNAAAFDAGKMSYKDFYTYAKSLGGNQFQLAKGFINTEAQAKGFNNQLKSGNSTTRTLAATLQKALGGVTGMRVALMLSGASAKTFAADSKAVAKAATATKGDVLGWANTQGTLAVKMDKAKASLQVMAVEIGTALIPAVGKLADAGTKAVHWIDGLSGGQKKLLAWSVGIAAAIGPVLSIGSRLMMVGGGITRAAVGISSALSAMAGASFTTSVRINNAVRGMTAALGGAAIGFAVGELTKNASTGAKALGVLGSAAAGAALGASAGPWGAVIGGIAGGVSALVTQWTGQSTAAKRSAETARAALAQEKSDANDLLASLQAVNGAYNAQYKTAVSSNLQKKGAFSQGEKLGISDRTVLSASLGAPDAIRQIDGVFQHLVAQVNAIDQTKHPVPKSLMDQITAYDKLFDILHIVRPAAADAEKGLDQVNSSLGKGEVPVKLLKGGWKNLRKELGQYGPTLATNTAYGARNSEIIKENIQRLNASASAQIKSGKSVDSVSRSYSNHIVALRATLKQMHFNSAAVDALIAKYDRTPKVKTTSLEAKTAKALAATGTVQRAINAIRQGRIPGITANTGPGRALVSHFQSIVDAVHGKTVGVGARVYGAQDLSYLAGTIAAIHDKTVTIRTVSVNGGRGVVKAAATGGFISGPGTATSDSIPARLSNGEYVINAHQTARNLSLLHAINAGAPGFAAGGRVGNSTQLHDVVAGIAGFLAAAHNFNASASDISAAARTLYGAAKADHASSRELSRLARTQATAVRDAQRRDSLRAQLGSRAAGTTAYDRLATAQQNYADTKSSVVSGFGGSFDIATSGVNAQIYNDMPAPPVSASSILSQLKTAAGNARTFSTLLGKLKKEGLNPTLIQQLAAAGPGALDQAKALAAATPASIKGINSSYGSLNAAASSAGSLVATMLYNSSDKRSPYYRVGVNYAQGVVNGLTSQINHLNSTIHNLGDGMVKQLKHTLGIKSPSRVMHGLGVNTAEGFRLGVASKHAAVKAEANRMVEKVADSTPSGTTGSGGDTHYHFHDMDVRAAFAAVERRQRMRARAIG